MCHEFFVTDVILQMFKVATDNLAVFAKGQLISEASFVGLTQVRTETLQKTFCLLFERLEANKN